MHFKLAKALDLLDINEFSIRDDAGTIVRSISVAEHAEALCCCLGRLGYFSAGSLTKAVDYLAAEKPFSCSKAIVTEDLIGVCEEALSNKTTPFDWFYFSENFCKEDYFQVDDIIDLIVFLNQTAFDRQFGVERNQLSINPFIAQHSDEFQKLAKILGVMTPLPPVQSSYYGTGIMGASSRSVECRIDYFNLLKVDCGTVWALSGYRKLSEDLDEERVMKAVAQKQKVQDITEVMMVNFLLEEKCKNKPIMLINSAVEQGHWRTTTEESARDIAKILLKKIQEEIQKEVVKPEKNTPPYPYHMMIIAEQPYSGRMQRQVQRVFNEEIQAQGLALRIVITVEGVGPGLEGKEGVDVKRLTRVNSELAALMAERFKDARIQYQTENLSVRLRDPKIIMYVSRDAAFQELNAVSQQPECFDTEKLGLSP